MLQNCSGHDLTQKKGCGSVETILLNWLELRLLIWAKKLHIHHSSMSPIFPTHFQDATLWWPRHQLVNSHKPRAVVTTSSADGSSWQLGFRAKASELPGASRTWITWRLGRPKGRESSVIMCMYVYIYIHVYTRIYTYAYLCMHIYIYIYVYTLLFQCRSLTL